MKIWTKKLNLNSLFSPKLSGLYLNINNKEGPYLY